MKIAVIGTGYVGLVAGACFADVGNHVVCVDHDPAKIAMLEAGGIPIYEPGLEDIVKRNVADGRLTFTTETPGAVQASDYVFIAVGTPPGEDGSADLKYVLAVAEAIARSMNGYKIVVCKSTVPVGTCHRVADVMRGLTTHPFDVVSNPEFLKEGAAIHDFMSPDRVVVGCDNPDAAQKVGNLYSAFMRRNERILVMKTRSSEMTKYASNSILATKISFMNEIANLCDAVGADVAEVRRGMSMDERIGPHFIYPGSGYGGSCFPKDVRALAMLGKSNGRATRILDAVEDVNNAQKTRLLDFARGYFHDELDGKRFAVWGLSFKPRTDDVREAPALDAIRALVAAGASVVATDPVAIHTAQPELADLGDKVSFSEDDYAMLEGADALFVFTEWNEFRSPDFARISSLLKGKVIFDGRNIYRPADVKAAGLTYFCIGRSTVDPAW
jgi:UDPglucose 6-dehydrogenase